MLFLSMFTTKKYRYDWMVGLFLKESLLVYMIKKKLFHGQSEYTTLFGVKSINGVGTNNFQ